MHRDLKPQNIMVENTGRVVVMDFGIAHSMEESGGTSTGMLLGTPAYVSPEQAKGEKIDSRSDVYTLGIVFYELLTGRIPFESETVIGLLLKRIQERPIPPVERNKEIPQPLSDIVLKCLVVEKEERYQTVQAVQADLEGWLASPTTFRTGMMTRAAEERLGKAEEGRTIVTPGMMMMARSNAWKWIAVSVAVAVLLIAGAFVALRLFSKPASLLRRPIRRRVPGLEHFLRADQPPSYSRILCRRLAISHVRRAYLRPGIELPVYPDPSKQQ